MNKYFCCPGCGMQFFINEHGVQNTAHSCPGQEGVSVVSPPQPVIDQFDYFVGGHPTKLVKSDGHD